MRTVVTHLRTPKNEEVVVPNSKILGTVFNEYGVQIMTPAYEGDPEQPKVVPPGQWHQAPAGEPEPPPVRVEPK